MAEPHAHSQPIQTYGPAPHNRNIWPHNSQATAAPSRLADSFVCFGEPSHITTLVCYLIFKRNTQLGNFFGNSGGSLEISRRNAGWTLDSTALHVGYYSLRLDASDC